MLGLVNVLVVEERRAREGEKKKKNLFHHSLRLTTDHYDATIAHACPIDQKTSSVPQRERERAREP